MAQSDWRFCVKCNGLFFNGFRNQGGPHPTGVCPKDRQGHVARGFNFHLDFDPNVDLPDTPKTQSKWRFCNRCFSLFFQGANQQDKHCPADDGRGFHAEQGFHFMIPINRVNGPVLNPETPTAQSFWHFCANCTGMMFKGFADTPGGTTHDPNSPANRGVCPGNQGGPHVIIGDTFVLPHDTTPTISLLAHDLNIRVTGQGFVPSGKVDIGSQVSHGSSGGVTTRNDQVQNDNDGAFVFEIPLASQNVSAAAVTATDDFTRLNAKAHLP
jgi:hypothetical protein